MTRSAHDLNSSLKTGCGNVISSKPFRPLHLYIDFKFKILDNRRTFGTDAAASWGAGSHSVVLTLTVLAVEFVAFITMSITLAPNKVTIKTTLHSHSYAVWCGAPNWLTKLSTLSTPKTLSYLPLYRPLNKHLYKSCSDLVLDLSNLGYMQGDCTINSRLTIVVKNLDD